MSVTIGNSAGATAIRPYTVPKVPEADSRHCVRVSRLPAGPTARPSPKIRKACRSR